MSSTAAVARSKRRERARQGPKPPLPQRLADFTVSCITSMVVWAFMLGSAYVLGHGAYELWIAPEQAISVLTVEHAGQRHAPMGLTFEGVDGAGRMTALSGVVLLMLVCSSASTGSFRQIGLIGSLAWTVFLASTTAVTVSNLGTYEQAWIPGLLACVGACALHRANRLWTG